MKNTANDLRTEEKLRKRKQAAAKKKPAPARPARKLSGIKAERSDVDREVSEIRQAPVRGKSGRAAIIVTYAAVRGRAKR